MVLLDETVVGVALDTIREDLGMSDLFSHWVVNAYLLTLTLSVAAAGRLADVIGVRDTFLVGAAVFGVASVAAGIAQSGEWLVAARAVQGVGGAFMFTIGTTMCGIAFEERQRGFAIGIYGVIGTIAIALGPFVGGVLVEFASWRWIFFLNIPIALAAVAIVLTAWRDPEGIGTRPHFDVRGLLGLSLLLGPLVLALMQAPEWGWDDPATIGLLALSALGGLVFTRVELRVPEPLIELELLARPTVLGANLTLLFAQFGKVSLIVFGALYLQGPVGFTPLEAGAALLLANALVPPGALIAGRVTDSRGARGPLLLGLVCVTASFAWIAALAGEESLPVLIPGLLLYGWSQGFLFGPAIAAILNAVPPEKRGEASGVLTTAQMLGGALAVPVLGAALLDHGYTEVFWVTAGLALVTLVISFFTVRPPAPAAAEPPAEAAPAS